MISGLESSFTPPKNSDSSFERVTGFWKPFAFFGLSSEVAFFAFFAVVFKGVFFRLTLLPGWFCGSTQMAILGEKCLINTDHEYYTSDLVLNPLKTWASNDIPCTLFVFLCCCKVYNNHFLSPFIMGYSLSENETRQLGSSMSIQAQSSSLKRRGFCMRYRQETAYLECRCAWTAACSWRRYLYEVHV